MLSAGTTINIYVCSHIPSASRANLYIEYQLYSAPCCSTSFAAAAGCSAAASAADFGCFGGFDGCGLTPAKQLRAKAGGSEAATAKAEQQKPH